MKNLLLALLIGLFALAGCTTGQKNMTNAGRLRVGMTKAQVLAIMGEPEKNETFHRPDIWYYYQETNWLDGFVTEDECFPVVFVNGKLAGFGHEYLTRHRIDKRTRIQYENIVSKDKAKSPAAGKSAK